MAARPWSAARERDGVTVTVRLTPKGGRDAIDGIEMLADGNTVLKVRVRAAPHEGAANEALCRVLAKTLDVPSSRVEIVSGATSIGKALTKTASQRETSSGFIV